MEREEVVRLADRVAAATPTLVWLVVHWQTTDRYEVIPQHELAPGAEDSGAVVMHVAHCAGELQVA